MSSLEPPELPKPPKPIPGGPLAARRRSLSSSREQWVEKSPPPAGRSLPLVVEPRIAGVDLASWIAEERAALDADLQRSGGILFRGFAVPSLDTFSAVVRAGSDAPMGYEDRTSPRSQVAGDIYTSTDFPPDQRILLHNENSYSDTWPGRIFFHCVTAAARGGETPVCDCRRVLARLDPDVVARFREQGVRYVRNFGDGLGLSWQEAFQTDRRDEVEAFCRRARIDWEWKDGGRLRTQQRRQAVLTHPVTGEDVWFNQAVLFHVGALDEETRRRLLAEFAEEDLPSHVFYGDGGAIEPRVLAEILAAYEAEAVRLPWQEGDILLLDNMLAAHGREAFEGPRKVVVMMADPVAGQPLS